MATRARLTRGGSTKGLHQGAAASAVKGRRRGGDRLGTAWHVCTVETTRVLLSKCRVGYLYFVVAGLGGCLARLTAGPPWPAVAAAAVRNQLGDDGWGAVGEGRRFACSIPSPGRGRAEAEHGHRTFLFIVTMLLLKLRWRASVAYSAAALVPPWTLMRCISHELSGARDLTTHDPRSASPRRASWQFPFVPRTRREARASAAL